MLHIWSTSFKNKAVENDTKVEWFYILTMILILHVFIIPLIVRDIVFSVSCVKCLCDNGYGIHVPTERRLVHVCMHVYEITKLYM